MAKKLTVGLIVSVVLLGAATCFALISAFYLYNNYQNSTLITLRNEDIEPSEEDTSTLLSDTTTQETTLPMWESEELKVKIENIIGYSRLSNFSVFIKDFKNGTEVHINQGRIVEPASIAKLPVAVLVMRDVDAGRATLEDTYPLWDREKFSRVGNLGELPNGTPVTLRRYLEELLIHSDHNAWYALVNYLGKSYQVVNPRIIDELGVNPLFLDPPQGTAQGVGKILGDLYEANTLTRESADYLLALLVGADAWTKNAIGGGLPTGTKFGNKIGILDDSGKLSYQDAAVVWGEKTDYVLVVMDENTEWEVAKGIIQEISKEVYATLNS